MSKTKRPSAAVDLNNARPVERAILGHCFWKPERAREIKGRFLKADFLDPFNLSVIEILVERADQNKTPSVEAVVARLGNDEVAPGVTVRDYLHEISREAIIGAALPWEDALETLLDEAHRRDVEAIAETLRDGAALAPSLSPVLAEVSEMIDTLNSALRGRRRDSYSAADAGASALQYLDTPDRNHPTTGLKELDEMLGGGWPLSELSVLAGRPGTGKTAVAISATVRAAKAGVSSLMFSLEMTKNQIGARMLTDLAYTHDRAIHYEDINSRKIDSDQRRRLEEAGRLLRELPIKIEEERSLLITDIGVRTRRYAAAVAKQGGALQLVVVDHLGLVRPSARYAGNRVRELAEICDGLAALGKEMDLAVLALCQLNRAVEDDANKRASLRHLRDSGEIEEIASVIAFAYRPAYYLERMKYEDAAKEAALKEAFEKTRHDLELNVAKNRNGRVGLVTAFVDIGANAVRNRSFVRR